MGVPSLIAQLREELPLHFENVIFPSNNIDNKVGLVIMDEINGFCTVGCGNLAPVSPDFQISKMIDETVIIAQEFSERGWPMLVFMDTHEANKPEPPYPSHCILGSGEETLVPDLAWLEQDANALLCRKDCINGFIGAYRKDGSNVVVDWIKEQRIQSIVVVGVCTDICVLDFVATLLSARNHGFLSPLEEVMIYSDACATYSFPTSIAKSIPDAVAHPQDIMHHMGLFISRSRGARIVGSITFGK